MQRYTGRRRSTNPTWTEGAATHSARSCSPRWKMARRFTPVESAPAHHGIYPALVRNHKQGGYLPPAKSHAGCTGRFVRTYIPSPNPLPSTSAKPWPAGWARALVVVVKARPAAFGASNPRGLAPYRSRTFEGRVIDGVGGATVSVRLGVEGTARSAPEVGLPVFDPPQIETKLSGITCDVDAADLQLVGHAFPPTSKRGYSACVWLTGYRRAFALGGESASVHDAYDRLQPHIPNCRPTADRDRTQ